MDENKIKLLKVAAVSCFGGICIGAGLTNVAAIRAINHMKTSNKLMFQAMKWCMDEGFDMPAAEARSMLADKAKYISISTMTMAEDLGYKHRKDDDNG